MRSVVSEESFGCEIVSLMWRGEALQDVRSKTHLLQTRKARLSPPQGSRVSRGRACQILRQNCKAGRGWQTSQSRSWPSHAVGY